MSESLHFWPEGLSENLPATPIRVLNEAAGELYQATKGALEAGITDDSSQPSGNKSYSFYVYSRALNYRTSIFRVSFDPTEPFPASIPWNDMMICQDADQLRQAVRSILQSEDVQKRVRALLAQSADAAGSLAS